MEKWKALFFLFKDRDLQSGQVTGPEHRSNLEPPACLTSTFLDCGRTLENQEPAHRQTWAQNRGRALLRTLLTFCGLPLRLVSPAADRLLHIAGGAADGGEANVTYGPSCVMLHKTSRQFRRLFNPTVKNGAFLRLNSRNDHVTGDVQSHHSTREGERAASGTSMLISCRGQTGVPASVGHLRKG